MTIAKIGGIAAEAAFSRLLAWYEAREDAPDDPGCHKWPDDVRLQIDAFADGLRANAVQPPVVFFVEWSDLWSMGDIYTHWLTPRKSPTPLEVHGKRFEVLAYPLPDGDRLARHLARPGRQWADEYNLYIVRLREAIMAWESLVDRSVIIVLREVVGGLVTDQELTESLFVLPEWLE